MCAFNTPQFVPGKRPNMRAFSRSVLNAHTHGGLFESTHGGVFHLLFSLFFISSLLFSLSNNDNDQALFVHTALTCLSVSVRWLRSIPCLANMFASCTKQLSKHNCANLVPLGMKWACVCAGNGCCVWLC